MNSASKFSCKAHHKLSPCSQPISFSSRSHTSRSVTEENTHHTAFTAVDRGEGSTSISLNTFSYCGFPKNKTQKSSNRRGCPLMQKHSYVSYLLSLLSAHSRTKATGLRDTSLQVKKYPFSTTKSLHALSPFLAHTSLSCLGTTINPTQGFKSSNSLLVPYHSLAFIALIRFHEIKSSG